MGKETKGFRKLLKRDGQVTQAGFLDGTGHAKDHARFFGFGEDDSAVFFDGPGSCQAVGSDAGQDDTDESGGVDFGCGGEEDVYRRAMGVSRRF